MKRNYWSYLGMLALLFLTGGLLALGASCMRFFSPSDKITDDAVVKLKLEGVILDGEKFLKQLKHYREEDHVRGILIVINSPGGVVGPSQEIYQEILRTREEFKLPVVVAAPGLMASGAYYAAVAADKIVVNPGTLMGSIGVIMEFANLGELYKWAKIRRYSIKTGKFKDTGAEYRPMSEEERIFLQGMLNEVLGQFKAAVAKGRRMSLEKLEPVADGRIMTGDAGVRLGLADETGGIARAEDLIRELAGLPADAEIFEPPKSMRNPFEVFFQSEDEGYARALERVLGPAGLLTSGTPMFLMPSARFSAEVL